MTLSPRRQAIVNAITADRWWTTKEVAEAVLQDARTAALSSTLLMLEHESYVERWEQPDNQGNVRRYFWRKSGGSPIPAPDLERYEHVTYAPRRAPAGPRKPERAVLVQPAAVAAQVARIEQETPKPLPAHGTITRWLLGDQCWDCMAAGARYKDAGGTNRPGALGELA